jgi:hypothetical protein
LKQQHYQRGQHPRAERGGNETKIQFLSTSNDLHSRRGFLMLESPIAMFAAKLTPLFSPNQPFL